MLVLMYCIGRKVYIVYYIMSNVSNSKNDDSSLEVTAAALSAGWAYTEDDC